MSTSRITTRSTIATTVARLLLVASLVCALPLLASCTQPSSSSDASAVASAIDDALTPLQNLDADGVRSTIENTLSEVDLSGLESLGSGAANIIAATFDGFDFSVSEIKVTGDTATATLVISCKNPADIASSVGNAVRSAASDVSIDTLSTDKLQSLIGDMLVQAIDNTPVTTYDPITVTLHKSNGKWELDDSSRQSITNVILGI